MSDNRTDLPSPNSNNFSQRVRETLMTYLGRQGNPLDRGLTLRDLLSAGLLKLRDGVTLRPGVPPPIEPGPAIDGAVDGTVDLTPPPQPTGFTATAGITNIIVEHDPPVFPMGGGYLRTRLYGATRQPGDPLPTFDDAVEIAQFTGQVYAHSTNPSTTWHLWIKWETKAGVLSPTPAGGTNGVEVRTGEDVTLLLDALQGQITESQLYRDLGARIDLIDGPASLPGSVAQRIAAEATARAQAILDEAAARGAAISAEAAARQAGDSSLASQITTLTASVSANAAAIANEAAVRADGDAAEAVARNTLAAQLRGNYTGSDINQVTTGLIYQERIARTNADSALAQDITALTAAVTNNVNSLTAAIQSESTARANADNALAQQINTLQSTVTTNNTTLTAAIQQEAATRASETGDLFAKYTVKIDTNGYVSGFGLASTANNATPTSEFIVRADSFAIASPSGPGITPAEPFFVRTTPTTINGVSVPAGVYIQDGFIQNGTITNAKIANAAIDDAKVANLSASKLTAGSIAVGSYIQSSNYVAGSQGWRIDGNGNAELSNAVVRGTIYASAGRIGGSVIGSTFIQSDTYQANVHGWRFNSDGTGQIGGFIVGTDHIRSSNYSAGSAGWRLDRNGNFEATNGTFRGGGTFSGALQAATGTFAGSLSAAAGTFRGELQAATGTFSGTLTAQAVNAVDTINLRGQAVTIPLSVFTSASTGGYTAATTLQSLSIVSTGAPIFVLATYTWQGDANNRGVRTRIIRSGVTVYDSGEMVQHGDSGGVITVTLVDTPGPGLFTYSVVSNTFPYNGSSGGIASARARTLLLLEVKR